MKKILSALIVLSVLLTAFVSCSGNTDKDKKNPANSADTEDTALVTENTVGKDEETDVAAGGSETDVALKTEKFDIPADRIDEVMEDFGKAMGGGSTLFNRKYVDDTYNLAFIEGAYSEEISILPEGALDEWIENVLLEQSPEEQEALPVLYQAIKGLDIPQEDLVALNDSRKQLGDMMILSDDFIDALYLPEEEMKLALMNPLALYYNGEIYTWEELNTATTLSTEPKSIPADVLVTYVNNLVDICLREGHISQKDVEAIFGEFASSDLS